MANKTGAYTGICPNCGSSMVKVLWSAAPRRKRECGVCGKRFTSIEILEIDLQDEDFSQIRYVLSLLAHMVKNG